MSCCAFVNISYRSQQYASKETTATAYGDTRTAINHQWWIEG